MKPNRLKGGRTGLRTHIKTILFAVVLTSLVAGSTGCVGLASGTLPPRLTAAEKARLKHARLPFTVGVRSKGLLEGLRKTKLFEAVDYVDSASRPDLMASMVSTPYGTAGIPVFSLLTFGIIPSTVREPLSFGCAFYPPNYPERSVKVEYLYYSHTTLGWVAALLAISPDVVMFPWRPDRHRRFYQHLSLAILDRSDEIGRLTEE